MWGTLAAGPYAPGFEIDWLKRSGHAVQRWRWYPARAGSGTPMTALDYGKAHVAGGPAGWPQDPRSVWATGYDEPGDLEKMSKLGALPVAARQGARPVRHDAPLVAIGQGFGFESPFHQHLLAEYLASWGYRVITSPLVSAGGAKADVSAATLAAEMADLAFLIAQEKSAAGLALIGYDLGGMAVVTMAGTGLVRPDLIVGIDSGLMSERLTTELVTSRPEFSWDRLTMPYLHFTRTAAENKARKLTEYFRIFEAAPAPRALIRVPQMRHADFGTIGAVEAVYPGLFGPVPGKPDLGYANTLFLIRSALDHWVSARARGSWSPTVRPPLTLQSW